MSRPEASPLYVFVYGTLRRGGSNDINRLAPPPRWIGEAEVAGTMYDLRHYPGVVLGGPRRVKGEVYAVTPPLLAVLDEIEEVHPQQTGEYVRRELPVDVAGKVLPCLLYEIDPGRVAGRPVIAGGDWIAHVAR
ncbi:gamma-glutamylcyclotransferase family protein [Pseudorhodoferax sp.]|uniref:gamma-glutamylcyclotransferase family protein n=1 Tax=Pseudorhodoferax sp. TaxID=1993553 RepID=UPI0039E6E9CC